ncbi:MAG: hypothetical protein L6367_10005 [Cellulomonas sp.]|nr:hypothetical protein [Cellulomonas sp.]
MSEPRFVPTADGTGSGEDVDDETVVRGTFVTLDRWRRIQGPFTPLSGSELARDDEDRPPFAVS